MERDIIRRLQDQALSALSLLTRLPLPAHTPEGAASAWAWPLVGALLGAIAALVAQLCLWMGLPSGPAAAAVLTTLALMTGGLHEDGLADTADGLMGGRTPDRRLEIMKDSRIGSFGAVALMLVTLARWSALTQLLAAGHVWAALIVAETVSRAPMAVIMSALPPARPSGLSAATGRPGMATAATACGLALMLALLLATASAPLMVLLAALACTGLALSARARLGGQTGDILGASQQLASAAVLSALAAHA